MKNRYKNKGNKRNLVKSKYITHSSSRNSKKWKMYDFLIPVFIIVLIFGAHYFNIINIVEFKIYDLLLFLEEPPSHNDDITFITINKQSITKMNQNYPIPRDIIANSLVLLKEFNAKSTLIDMNFNTASIFGIDKYTFMEELEADCHPDFLHLQTDIVQLFNAINYGDMNRYRAKKNIEKLAAISFKTKDKILNKIKSLIQDKDEYLGQAIQYNGQIFIPVAERKDDAKPANKALQEIIFNKSSINEIDGNLTHIHTVESIVPPVFPVLESIKGIGFTQNSPDPDGITRQTDLFFKYKDKVFTQLGFAALHHSMGNPEIIIEDDRIILKKANVNGEIQDIIIPLTEEKKVLIHHHLFNYYKCYNQLDYMKLVKHDLLENDLLNNLRIMNEHGYLHYYKGEENPYTLFMEANNLKNKLLLENNKKHMEDYITMRRKAYTITDDFILSHTMEQVKKNKLATLKGDAYTQLNKLITTLYHNTGKIFQELATLRTDLKNKIADSFCFIGYVNPINTDTKAYFYHGNDNTFTTSAGIIRTIQSQRFFDNSPWWHAFLIGSLLSIIFSFLVFRSKLITTFAAGLFLLFFLIFCLFSVFVVYRIHINFFTPCIIYFLTFLSFLLLKTLRTAKNKSRVQSSFTLCFSDTTGTHAVSNPPSSQLAGKMKQLSGLFTDLKGIHHTSLQRNPKELERIFDIFYSNVNDAIWNQEGRTIHYKDNTVMGIFGVLKETPDHVINACYAALHMKKIEQTLNNYLGGRNLPTVYIRAGVHAGNMVIENNGNEKENDYTINGNELNLGPRLVLLNKIYKTQLLVSNVIHESTDNMFYMRKLDWILIHPLQKPICIYELMDEKENLSTVECEALDIFKNAMQAFILRKWELALNNFLAVKKLLPDDGPSALYIKRCKKYLKKPPHWNWDSVYRLV